MVISSTSQDICIKEWFVGLSICCFGCSKAHQMGLCISKCGFGLSCVQTQ